MIYQFKVGDKVIYNSPRNTSEYLSNESNGFIIDSVYTISSINKNGDYLSDMFFTFEENENSLCAIEVDLVLTKKEFSSLLNTIEPVKNRVNWVSKKMDCTFNYIIEIDLGNEVIEMNCHHPYSGSFDGLKENKKYSLEDLGFTKPKAKLNCKVRCISCSTPEFKVGKVYGFENGYFVAYLEDEKKVKTKSTKQFTSIEDFNEWSKLIKVAEVEE